MRTPVFVLTGSVTLSGGKSDEVMQEEESGVSTTFLSHKPKKCWIINKIIHAHILL